MNSDRVSAIPRCLVISALLVLAVFGGISRAAETDTQGIDAVILLDCSGSMKKTDPMMYRKPAARMFISLLGEDDRAAVVGFSDTAEVFSGLTPAADEAGRQRLVKALERIQSTGAHTNLYEALSKGYDLLKPSPKKKKMIILMSDGRMDVGDRARDSALISAMKTTLISEARGAGIKIYTMAFSDEADRDLLRDVARLGGGLFISGRSDRNLHLDFASIFERAKSPDSLPIENDSFIVDDSVREMTLLLTKKTAGTSISVFDPSGRAQTARNHDPRVQWFDSPVFEMVTLMNPERGKWSLKYNAGEGNKVYIVANLRLASSFDRFFVPEGENIKIEAWLEREKDQLNVREILDQVGMTATIVMPGGRRVEVKLADGGTGGDDAPGDGIYAGLFRPPAEGDYRLLIRAGAKTFTREKEYRFSVFEPAVASPSDSAVSGSASTATTVEEQEESVNWGMVIMKFVAINLFCALLYYGGGKGLSYLRIKTRGKS